MHIDWRRIVALQILLLQITTTHRLLSEMLQIHLVPIATVRSALLLLLVQLLQ